MGVEGAAMNDLALIAIGLLFGIVLAVVAGAAGFLFWTAIQMRKEAAESKKEVSAAIKSNTVAIDKMRGEVALALGQMDAQRLYEASVGIIGAKKQLTAIVNQLNKVVFAAAPEPAPPTGFTMEDEAADDARMIEERNRWLAQQPDPIPAEQVNDFFEQRRRNNKGGIRSMSTPPPDGAYLSITEAQPEKPVATLPDLGDEELTGVGELK